MKRTVKVIFAEGFSFERLALQQLRNLFGFCGPVSKILIKLKARQAWAEYLEAESASASSAYLNGLPFQGLHLKVVLSHYNRIDYRKERNTGSQEYKLFEGLG